MDGHVLFPGNANLVYTIIRKRQVYYQLANLATDNTSIAKSLANRKGKLGGQPAASGGSEAVSGATSVVPQVKSPSEEKKEPPTMEGASMSGDEDGALH